MHPVSETDESSLSHKEVIEASWYRCESYGLSHGSNPDFGDTQVGDVSALLDQHHNLVKTTESEVLPYYENILTNSSCIIVLADSRGQVLNTWGASRFLPRMQHGLLPGHLWKEEGVGTNAIGTALATGQAVQVNRDEHFLRANRFMAGSASPIFDTQKSLVGVLDISTDAYLPQDHTLGLVKLMSLCVENQLILSAFQDSYHILTISTHTRSLDSHWAALVVIDSEGVIISSNRRASIMLTDHLALMNVEALFGCRVRDLINQPATVPLSLMVQGRFRVWVRVQPPAKPSLALVLPDYRTHANYEQPKAQHQPKAQPTPALTNSLPDDVIPFDELEQGDDTLRKVLHQAKKIIEKDIPILISGETGAGKEVLVRSLHYHSSRANAYFVAVNCASIPTELVESELFGYEKGAFTGASSRGYQGLIRRAHKGTLFLDEIGEMPIHVQARLLRVLQDRIVTPLGSTESYPVDIRLVSATNRDLKHEIAAGRFRQDLYYRIAGLNLEILPLRQRQDKAALIQYIFKRICREYESAGMSLEVQRLLESHPWPGNVRQLVNVLKVALAMADGELLELEHLPLDILEDISLSPNSETDEDSTDGDSEEMDASRNLAELIPELYQRFGGNVSKTARAAGVSRNTVYKYLNL